ncbi:MAG: DUF4231 domain-containing protein [Moorea sp. SIO2B7]|nr:DUF4231 domain-containing protein [Moorena sp. SIO2B7]
MAKKNSYQDYLKQEFSELIDQLEITELQKYSLKSRWLDQLLWLEGRADKFRNRYHKLRMVTVIGGVILPALVSLNICNEKIRDVLGWRTFGLTQVVAISTAVEEFFHYGDRYRHYRNTAEGMKIEAWSFFQLSGSY